MIVDRLFAFVFLVIGGSLASPALADLDSLESRAWYEVSSENFRIKSVLDEERTTELLRHLEIMRASLAQMALRFENIDGAERWFSGVLSDIELRAHGEAGLGRVLGLRGDAEGANEHFDKAIRLMAWDFDIWMDYAQYWAQRVSTAYDHELRLKYASRLLEAASAAAPHDQASRLLLANAYLYVGRFDDAVEVAESVLLFEHQPGAITSAAHEVISEVERRGSR